MITTNPFTTDNYMKAVDELKAVIAKQADEIERLREKVAEWRQAASAEASERRKSHDEIERLREDLIEAEKYNGYHQQACLEIERLRVLLKNILCAWDAWDIETDNGDAFMNVEDVIETARSALQQNGSE